MAMTRRSIWTPVVLGLWLGFLTVVIAGESASPPPTRSLDTLAACQRAIEQVLWSHREWPSSNPRSKPTLEEIVPPSVFRARAEDALRKSAVLRQFWSHDVTPAMLRAELERIARGSRDPATLREMLTAVGTDTVMQEECLARPLLADRLVRGAYAYDPSMHANSRERAAAEWQTLGTIAPIAGVMTTKTWQASGADPKSPDSVVGASSGAWRETLDWLGDVYDRQVRDTSDLPRGAWSPLHEERDSFLAVKIEKSEPGRLDAHVVSWPKRTFDEWWSVTRSSLPVDLSLADRSSAAAATPPASVPTENCHYDTWTPLGGVPSPLWNPTAVWTGTEMIVWGGGFRNTGGRYNPATDTWVPVTDYNAPIVRNAHTAVWTGTEMIIWGGNNNTTTINSGGRYDPVSDTWTATSELGAPSPREEHTAIWTGTEMIVWGGKSGYSATYSGGIYDPESDSWRPMTSGPSSRWRHTAVWTGSEMIVWGGFNYIPYSGHYWYSDGGIYEPLSDTWRWLSGPGERGYHSAVWTGSEMIIWGGVWGGSDGTNIRVDGYRYDPATGGWATMLALPFSPPYRPTAVWTSREMILWGGRDWNTGQDSKAGFRYSPSADSWVATSQFGAPSRRSFHTAIWTGREMVVWGGGTDNTGGRYSPGSDSWLPTSTDGPAEGRRNHALLWTGAELVYWGGNSGQMLADGSRYLPALDSWEPLSTTNAPEARSGHSAVWTGTDVIIWGGESMDARLQSGALYSPALDTWRATSVAGAPAPRTSHTAVWTGSSMVVWGGNGDRDLRSGGQYRPDLDAWTPTTLINAPTARSRHTAVWTGSEMIVWGGDLYGPTGARYNPGGDAWNETSPINAPSGRRDHTAVWTGAHMIVWGGTDGATSLGNGGRYSPSLDAWENVSSSSAPVARSRHSAVWTGRAMLLWGGFDGLQNAASGSKYIPPTDTWEPIAALHVPRARSDHRAAWIGDQMIVWGGYGPTPTGQDPYPNAGHTYCPCESSDTTCDGLDNDCTGVADDGFVGGSTWCGVGACQSTGMVSCISGVETNTCVPGVPAPDDSLCNGVDDDCDGPVDDDVVVHVTDCGIGACAREGESRCVDGLTVDSCVPGEPASGDLTCDGIDDDCDGSPDQDYVPQEMTCGTGACVASGQTRCSGGAEVDDCVPGVPAANDATCNGSDDDCDGVSDEDYQPLPTSCGVGACAATGGTSCVLGAVLDSCTPGTPTPTDATCNSIDEDCNGSSDEDYVSRGTSCGIGACRRTGATSCMGGIESDSCIPGTPAFNDTLCNGIDEDCDGSVDEDFVAQPITCGIGACMRSGTTACVGGQFRTDCTPGTPAPNDATCDGIDNDCDGSVDEDGPCLDTYPDADGDGFGAATDAVPSCCATPPGRVTNNLDCNDADPSVWAVPGEALELRLTGDTLSWGAPDQLGATAAAVQYDTLRSGLPSQFTTATCIDTRGADLATVDREQPPVGSLFAYLVRATNACPSGTGPLGKDAAGNERVGAVCP